MNAATLLLLIFAGGAAGAVSRFHLVRLMERHAGLVAWLGILIVNVLGCLVIGILAAVISAEPAAKALLITGLLGGFTTFSTAMLDAWILRLRCELELFLVAFIGTPLLGIPAAALGLAIGGGLG